MVVSRETTRQQGSVQTVGAERRGELPREIREAAVSRSNSDSREAHGTGMSLLLRGPGKGPIAP